MSLLLSLFVFCSICVYAQDQTLVKTTFGPVRGVAGQSVRYFLGIPYAKPPVGDLRWKAPQPPVPWSSPLNATAFGVGCPQLCHLPPLTCPDKQSEDCLTLNVFTPLVQNLNNKLQPVMVYIHGGGYDQGASGVLLYDNTVLVSTGNVVAVTFNYRLGVLGYLASRSGQIAGNYGLLDQIFVLNWVRDNIKFFGGDPNNVNIVGESAGAASVRSLLVSPRARGLYIRAVMLSDPLAFPNIERETMYSMSDTFLKATGCANENCLRSLNASTLILAQKKMFHVTLENIVQAVLPFSPMVDGDLVPMRWEKAILTGNWNKVPLIIGTTTEEARLFVYGALTGKLGSVLYTSVLGLLYRLSAVKVGIKYPPMPFGDNRDLISRLLTDYLFTCPARYLLQLLQPSNPVVYNYVFGESIQYNGWGTDFQFCYGHPCHASDLPLFFDPVPGRIWNFTASEKRLSQSMVKYYVNFMRNGDPNVGLSVPLQWPRWTNQKRTAIMFQGNMQLTDAYNNETCNWWDKLGYGFGFRNISK